MSGRTNMVVGYWNQHFTHIPVSLAVHERKRIKTDSLLWQTVLLMNA
jgi:6-phosphofructokinase 1